MPHFRLFCLLLIFWTLGPAWSQGKFRTYTNPQAGYTIHYPEKSRLLTGPPNHRIDSPVQRFRTAGQQFVLCVEKIGEESEPFLALETKPVPPGTSPTAHADLGWTEFLKKRREVLKKTDLVKKKLGHSTAFFADYQEKVDGEMWTSRVVFILDAEKHLGYQLVTLTHPASFAQVAAFFERIISSLETQKWHNASTILVKGSIIRVDTLGTVALVTVGTYHGQAWISLEAADVEAFLKILSSGKSQTFYPRCQNQDGVSKTSIKLDFSDPAKVVMFVHEGDIAEGARFEPSTMDSKAVGALKKTLQSIARSLAK